MEPRIIFETGIRLWEQNCRDCEGPFATISLVALKPDVLQHLLKDVLSTCGGGFSRWFRWHTLGYECEGNRIQKARLARRMSMGFGAFNHRLVGNTDQIPFSIANVELPLGTMDLEALRADRRDLLIGTTGELMEVDSVAAMMAPYAKGYDAQALGTLLHTREDLVFARFYYDGDTHCCFQWLGHEPDLRSLELGLARLGVQPLPSRDCVADMLSR